jgi:hypothetical protein
MDVPAVIGRDQAQIEQIRFDACFGERLGRDFVSR